MRHNEYEYVMVDLSESIQEKYCAVSDISPHCSQLYQTTISCGISLCHAINGTMPKLFNKNEISAMNVRGQINRKLMNSRFWLDLRLSRSFNLFYDNCMINLFLGILVIMQLVINCKRLRQMKQ